MGWNKKDRDALAGYEKRISDAVQKLGFCVGPLDAFNYFAELAGFIDFADYKAKTRGKVQHKMLHKLADIESELNRRLVAQEPQIFTLKPVAEIDREKIKQLKDNRPIIKPRT